MNRRAGQSSTMVFPEDIHERLKQFAEAEGTSMSAIVMESLRAYFKAKRDGISYNAALGTLSTATSEADQKRRELMRVAQDKEKPVRIRVQSYIEAKHDIPADLATEAMDYFATPDAMTEKDAEHYEEGEVLRYIPPGFDRYRKTREYWFDSELLTNPDLQEAVVQYRVSLGFDELAMRQRLAQILASPPNETENGYDFFSRIHKISVEEAMRRIARGD